VSAVQRGFTVATLARKGIYWMAHPLQKHRYRACERSGITIEGGMLLERPLKPLIILLLS
jgi:hypothetical protein